MFKDNFMFASLVVWFIVIPVLVFAGLSAGTEMGFIEFYILFYTYNTMIMIVSMVIAAIGVYSLLMPEKKSTLMDTHRARSSRIGDAFENRPRYKIED